MFNPTRIEIEVRLTVVFTTSSAKRFMQDVKGASLKKIITVLRALRGFTDIIGDSAKATSPVHLRLQTRLLMNQDQ